MCRHRQRPGEHGSKGKDKLNDKRNDKLNGKLNDKLNNQLKHNKEEKKDTGIIQTILRKYMRKRTAKVLYKTRREEEILRNYAQTRPGPNDQEETHEQKSSK